MEKQTPTSKNQPQAVSWNKSSVLTIAGVVVALFIIAWVANSLSVSFGWVSPSLYSITEQTENSSGTSETDSGSTLPSDVVEELFPIEDENSIGDSFVDEVDPLPGLWWENNNGFSLPGLWWPSGELQSPMPLPVAPLPGGDEQLPNEDVIEESSLPIAPFPGMQWNVSPPETPAPFPWPGQNEEDEDPIIDVPKPAPSFAFPFFNIPTLDFIHDWFSGFGGTISEPQIPDLPQEMDFVLPSPIDEFDEPSIPEQPDEDEDSDTQYTDKSIWCQIAPSSPMCRFAVTTQKHVKFFLDRVKTILSRPTGHSAGFDSSLLGNFRIMTDNLRESVQPVLENIYDYVSDLFGIEGEVVDDPNSLTTGSRIEIAARAMLNYLHARNVQGLSVEAALDSATIDFAFEADVIELDLRDNRMKYIPYQPEGLPTVYYATSGPYEFVGPWEHIEGDFAIAREYNSRHLGITLDPPTKAEATVVDIQCPVMDWRENFDSYDGVPPYVFKYSTMVCGSCDRQIDYFTGVGVQMHEFVDRAENYSDQLNLSRHLLLHVPNRSDLDRPTTGRWVRYDGFDVKQIHDVVLTDGFLDEPTDTVVRQGDAVRFIIDESDKKVQLVSLPVNRFMCSGTSAEADDWRCNIEDLGVAKQYGFSPIGAWLYGGSEAVRPLYSVEGVDIRPAKKVYSVEINSGYDHALHFVTLANDGKASISFPDAEPRLGSNVSYLLQEKSAELPRI